MRILFLAMASLSLAAISSLSGQSQERIPPTKPKTAEEQSALRALTDEQFAERATQINLTEIALGSYAGEKAKRTEIQQFGRHLKEAHTKTNQQLQMIMKKRGLSFPAKIDSKHQAKVDKLTAIRGEDFDRAYLREAKESHKMASLLYLNESENGKVDEFRAYAGQTLPAIRDHLKKAEQLWDVLFVTGR